MAQPDPTPIDRRQYLRLTGALAAGATTGLAGCAESIPGSENDDADSSSATGLLSTAVSDRPGDIDDFESCIVTIDGIWVGPAGSGSVDSEEDENEEDATGDGNDTAAGEDSGGPNETGQDGGGPPGDTPAGRGSSDGEASGSQSDDGSDTTGTSTGGNGTAPEPAEDGTDGNETDGGNETGQDGEEDGDGRTYYEFDEPQEADLTELQGDAQQLVGEHELSVGTYQFLQLDVGGIEGTLIDGSEAQVDTPGNAPLKFNQSFDVREGYRTTFLADFTPVERGNGTYLFQPVAAETEVNYEEIESGSDDGPAESNETTSTAATEPTPRTVTGLTSMTIPTGTAATQRTTAETRPSTGAETAPRPAGPVRPRRSDGLVPDAGSGVSIARPSNRRCGVNRRPDTAEGRPLRRLARRRTP